MTFFTLQPLWWLLLVLPLIGLLTWRSLVDRPGKLKWAAAACRGLALVCLLLAICRPFWTSEEDSAHIAFVVDVSESVDVEGMRAAAEVIDTSVEALRSGDEWSLFMAANGVRKVSRMELDAFIEECDKGTADAEFRSASSLAENLSAVRTVFPSGKARKVVLLSDGVSTDEGLEQVLETLSREAITVQLREIASLGRPEAAVVSLDPMVDTAFEGEVVRMEVKMASNVDVRGRLRMLHRGVVVTESEVNLNGGENTRAWFDVPMTTPGASRWTAELLPEEDHFPLNNQVTAVVNVEGKPNVLLLHRKPVDMREFTRLLEKQGIAVDVRTERGLPDQAESLLTFDAVLIADVPATDLSSAQMVTLKRYVEDFGGGLVMFGSENSFGLGGYYKTPVEEVLPLVSRYEKEKEKPSMAMILVIDKSGSMSGTPIALARQAARSAAELLGGRDMIGVVGFDGQPRVVLEMTAASRRDEVASAIDSLAAGGGTDLFPAMVRARDMLRETAAKIKHMIVLSDGQTHSADFLGLTQELVDAGVTVSTVALGSGAARELMAAIAQAGNGRYYETADPANVPQIFTRETVQASRSAIKEDLFGTVVTGDHPMLAGYEKAEFPFSLGYVMTQAKPTAQVLLVAETGDPLLAVGRYGLGQGLAFSADMTERWGGEWLSWSGGGKFWAQALRSILRREDGTGIKVSRPVEDADSGSLVMTVRRTDLDGRPLNGVNWATAAVNENGKEVPAEMTEIGLGRYRLEVDRENSERLLIRMMDKEAGKLKLAQWEEAYPAEYQLGAERTPAFENVDEFSPSDPAAGVGKVLVRSSAAPLFVFLAAGFVLLGLVLRRI